MKRLLVPVLLLTACGNDAPVEETTRSSAGSGGPAATVESPVQEATPPSVTAGEATAKTDPPVGQPVPSSIYREIAEETGLRFQHFNGATGEFFYPEIMGSGAALFDYDNDGDLDLYLVQGNFVDPNGTREKALVPPPLDQPRGNRLFRNELAETGSLRFTDVTEAAGVGHEGVGMGVAVGDFDNDGYADLYVTNFGPNVLYRNRGDGTFADITKTSGTDDPRFSSSASFLDYDRDGDLDLYVVSYVSFNVQANRRCAGPLGFRDYCNPAVFPPEHDRLFRNDGGGKFTDVTVSSGIGAVAGPGLGVVAADFDQDGWTDIYVANDGRANQLWMNREGKRFEDTGLMSGSAFNADGDEQAGMGVAAGDFDGDGDEDLFVTHLTGETNALYVNDGTANFYDSTGESGLGSVSLRFTSFGCNWTDYDNDGDGDLFVANGAVIMEKQQVGKHVFPYQQTNQLFRNDGNTKFTEVTQEAGPAFALLEVSRAAAFGDVDNDGDVDVVVTNSNGPVRLYLNQTGNRRRWLSVVLIGTKSNREGAGAKVALLRKGRPPLWQRAHRDGSHMAANDIRVLFGLGDDPSIEGIAIQWPSGGSEIWRDGIRADTQIELQEGTGAPWPAASRTNP